MSARCVLSHRYGECGGCKTIRVPKVFVYLSKSHDAGRQAKARRAGGGEPEHQEKPNK